MLGKVSYLHHPTNGIGFSDLLFHGLDKLSNESVINPFYLVLYEKRGRIQNTVFVAWMLYRMFASLLFHWNVYFCLDLAKRIGKQNCKITRLGEC